MLPSPAADPPQARRRRLASATALVALAGAAWWPARPLLESAAARWSFGGMRDDLIVAELARRNPEAPPPSSLLGSGATLLHHFGPPADGWLFWRQSGPGDRIGADAPEVRYVYFADRSFRTRGRMRSEEWPLTRPVDADGDGRWEVLTFVRRPGGAAYLLLRLGDPARGEEYNEVLAAVRPSRGGPAMRRSRRIAWRDAAGGGRELVLQSVGSIGGTAAVALDDLAILHWRAGGDGGLPSVHLLAPERVEVVLPPGGRPERIAISERLDDVAQRMLGGG